jgi:hypothetical protein
MNRLIERLISWFLWAGTMFLNPATNPKLFPTSFAQASSAEKIHDLGGFDFKLAQLTGPASYTNSGVYATSGVPMTPSLFGLRALEWVVPICVATGGYDLQFDPATGNVHFVVSSTGAEAANAVNLSGVLFFVLCAGIR